MDAQTRAQELMVEITEMMQEIDRNLDKVQRTVNSEKVNWAHVGSLAHMLDELQEVKRVSKELAQ